MAERMGGKLQSSIQADLSDHFVDAIGQHRFALRIQKNGRGNGPAGELVFPFGKPSLHGLAYKRIEWHLTITTPFAIPNDRPGLAPHYEYVIELKVCTLGNADTRIEKKSGDRAVLLPSGQLDRAQEFLLVFL